MRFWKESGNVKQTWLELSMCSLRTEDNMNVELQRQPGPAHFRHTCTSEFKEALPEWPIVEQPRAL